jgi:hypothetical protein
MTVIGALSSFRELGEMSPHKRACVDSSIHCFTKLWNVGLIPSAPAAYHRSNQDEGLRLGSRPTAVCPHLIPLPSRA